MPAANSSQKRRKLWTGLLRFAFLFINMQNTMDFCSMRILKAFNMIILGYSSGEISESAQIPGPERGRIQGRWRRSLNG